MIAITTNSSIKVNPDDLDVFESVIVLLATRPEGRIELLRNHAFVLAVCS
jgi:hypothetical protein